MSKHLKGKRKKNNEDTDKKCGIEYWLGSLVISDYMYRIAFLFEYLKVCYFSFLCPYYVKQFLYSFLSTFLSILMQLILIYSFVLYSLYLISLQITFKEDCKHRAKYAVFIDLFSSGMCTAIISSGSRHWTTQPCLSLTRAVSTLRKVLGMRLHSTATMVCTSRRGGHCGMGFLCSLLNMAEESGMASCEVSEVREKY